MTSLLRRTAAFALATIVLLACAPLAAAPQAPSSIYAVRVGPGVIGVDWQVRRPKGISGFRLYRSEKLDGPYQPIADRKADQPFYLDADVKPSTVYLYRVASLGEDVAESEKAGTACAWDNDQLLANGSFELDPLGPMEGQPASWPRRAYNWKTPVVIIEGGPDGRQCVEIRSSNTLVSGGFHSGAIPAIEGEVFDQFCWTKALPGARPSVGRCILGEDRKGVKVGSRPYDYTGAGKPRKDGWTPHEGSFTVPKTGRYCVLWLIGYQARNTFWLDGARLVDRTSQRVRAFDAEAMRAEVAKALEASATARKQLAEFQKLETEMADCRKHMAEDRTTLSPLDYRRLLVRLDRAQQAYTNLLWEVKTMGLLLD